MTRKEMEAVIKGGGSVLIHYPIDEKTGRRERPSRVISRLEDMPGYAELPLTDEERAQTIADLKQQQARLAAELKAIGVATA